MQAAEWAPILATLTALAGAVLAFWSSRRKPAVDDATAQKIKEEIVKEQQANALEKAAADAKRDRHIIRLETWGFQEVRPWSRRATIIVDEQNDLLCKLAQRAGIPYERQHLDPLPDMPQIVED